jgi:hypothetical protein
MTLRASSPRTVPRCADPPDDDRLRGQVGIEHRELALVLEQPKHLRDNFARRARSPLAMDGLGRQVFGAAELGQLGLARSRSSRPRVRPLRSIIERSHSRAFPSRSSTVASQPCIIVSENARRSVSVQAFISDSFSVDCARRPDQVCLMLSSGPAVQVADHRLGDDPVRGQEAARVFARGQLRRVARSRSSRTACCTRS